MARYLIIRLSAMGDVAMLIPLLYAVARANEQHEFILLTQPFFTGSSSSDAPTCRGDGYRHPSWRGA